MKGTVERGLEEETFLRKWYAEGRFPCIQFPLYSFSPISTEQDDVTSTSQLGDSWNCWHCSVSFSQPQCIYQRFLEKNKKDVYVQKEK